MIETLYRILETRCRPHMYDLPGVGRKEVMEVKERVRAHVDPDAPEAREGGWVYLTDLPSLADRFAAVVAAFLELEKNPWKPGDVSPRVPCRYIPSISGRCTFRLDLSSGKCVDCDDYLGRRGCPISRQ